MSNEHTDKQTYTYWQSCIKRSLKAQPRDQWKAAYNRLNIEKDITADARGGNEEPYVNGFRQHYEALKSFLDQNIPDFKVTPSAAHLTDMNVLKESEAERVYLEYLWREQRCQRLESKKLDSVLIKNVGATCPVFDKSKWMPGLKYISAENLLLDPDCNGNRENAKWEGYWENVTIEELTSQHKLTGDQLDRIRKSAGSLLEEEEKENIDEEDTRKFNVIKVYHIFAKGDAAVRKMDEDTEAELTEQQKKELDLSTPKKYLKFVDGYYAPLIEEDGWPYELDDNEFPTTVLSFNTVSESLYSFTDYKQMKRLDQMFDNVMYDIEQASYWAANKKFGGTVEAMKLTQSQLEDFLNNFKRTYQDQMIGSDGKALIQQIDTGRFDQALVQALELVDDKRNKASLLSELLSDSASEYKDVTAIAARIHDANVHQQVNRRLGGPYGYEDSIAEDAVKLLEIAHQYIPRYSVIEVSKQSFDIDENGDQVPTGETFRDFEIMQWEVAERALLNPDNKLFMLGADAILGPELALHWYTMPSDEFRELGFTDEFFKPKVYFKLTTKVQVIPGSTRQVTKEQKAATLKQYYNEVFMPIYQSTGRFDLAIRFAERIAALIDLGDAKDYLPKEEELQQYRMPVQPQSPPPNTGVKMNEML